MNYKVKTNIKNHLKLQNKITRKLWPEFMLHDSVSNKYWSKLYELFPDYQFSLFKDDEIIGIANCLPFYWDKQFSELPETGWDWVLEKGINDKKKGKETNILNGLQIAVNPRYQGHGFSSQILKEMFKLAARKGLSHITIPVRPSLKKQISINFNKQIY